MHHIVPAHGVRLHENDLYGDELERAMLPRLCDDALRTANEYLRESTTLETQRGEFLTSKGSVLLPAAS